MPPNVIISGPAETATAAVKVQVDAMQPAYLAAHGHYWQGILTPIVLPADGVELAADYTVKPTDQAEDWTVLSVRPLTLPMSVECHVHKGPLGDGYTVYDHVVEAAVHWVKAIGAGPHSATFDWTELKPDK